MYTLQIIANDVTIHTWAVSAVLLVSMADSRLHVLLTVFNSCRIAVSCREVKCLPRCAKAII